LFVYRYAIYNPCHKPKHTHTHKHNKTEEKQNPETRKKDKLCAAAVCYVLGSPSASVAFASPSPNSQSPCRSSCQKERKSQRKHTRAFIVVNVVRCTWNRDPLHPSSSLLLLLFPPPKPQKRPPLPPFKPTRYLLHTAPNPHPPSPPPPPSPQRTPPIHLPPSLKSDPRKKRIPHLSSPTPMLRALFESDPALASHPASTCFVCAHAHTRSISKSVLCLDIPH